MLRSDDIRELGRCHSIGSLAASLQAVEPIVYSCNGNRARRGEPFLKKLQLLAPSLGIERLADISFLAASDYPVFQSCRPNVFTHTRVGQNTGAQGKGPTATQAKISCLMEAIEGFSMEPKSMVLMRGDRTFMGAQHPICDVRTLPMAVAAGHAIDQPLMWTEGYELGLQAPVLLPAEGVYFPFFAKDYDTPSIFTYGSNGVAAGATYLEALIHALYEVIERHYRALMVEGALECEAIDEGHVEHPAVQRFIATARGEFELQLYNLRIPGVRNMPVILCVLAGDGIYYEGCGCSLTVDISIHRAVSEALQTLATIQSGTREDLARGRASHSEAAIFGAVPQPQFRTLTPAMLKRRVLDLSFTSLNQELAAIRRWLRGQGSERVFVANLTRVGVDIPVVRAIVPGMQLPPSFNVKSTWTTRTVIEHQFRLRPLT